MERLEPWEMAEILEIVCSFTNNEINKVQLRRAIEKLVIKSKNKVRTSFHSKINKLFSK